MKILFISMPSIHVVRWLENLKHTDHEIYWLNVLGTEKINTSDKVIQIVNWKKRRLPYIKGEYFLKKKIPQLYTIVSPYLEISANRKLEEIILQINPDVIHSFEMQTCCYPIFKTMRKFSKIRWIYSCWGNDLYYYKNFKSHERKIKLILKRVNFLHTDCIRDYKLATDLGFNGENIGVIPGGGGYDLEELNKYLMPISTRNVILIKGYQHLFGKALNVIRALENMQEKTTDYEIVVFGAHKEVIDYIATKKLPFKTFHRHELSQHDLIKLMGKSLIYIGNNSSDGMANTLLEAIIMNAFPIQSNPGNVTAEIIKDGINGLLINDADNINEIKDKIIFALDNPIMLTNAIMVNNEVASRMLTYKENQNKIVSIY